MKGHSGPGMASGRGRKTTICVVGIWHLGAVNAVGFVEKGYRVIGLELDPAKARSLQNGRPPLFEPGLQELMVRQLKRGVLSFVSNVECVAEADYVVIAYDSPVNEKDEVDIGPVVNAARSVGPHLKPNVPLVITSQVPLGTSSRIEAEVKRANPAWKSGVVYTPENLKLGSAISRFLEPDMLVLGADQATAARAALLLYRPFKTAKLPMDLKSAEMVKHALNTFLATSISFINEIANLSDRLGADAVAVGQALKHDKRIGMKALMSPGLGFSGGTLARDVTQLRKFAVDLKYQARLLDSIMSVNEGTFDEIVFRLRSKLGNLNGKRIGVLGLTYKAGTSALRRSPAIRIIRMLCGAGAICIGFDPKADPQEMKEYRGLFERASKIGALARNADALVLVTEWPEFKDLPFESMAKSMKTPFIVDSKNYLDPETMVEAGFDYQGFGRTRARR
jgi:UDPglucose 6-dehydrogenase